MGVLELYSTSPGYVAGPRERVLEAAVRSWRAADEAGLRGALIFTDNHSLDPFAVAQRMLESTGRLVPLVAVQPPFAHPFHVARQISTLAYLYDRGVDLNLVTGGDPRQLLAVGDDLEHDTRYDRLVEFGQVLTRLLEGGGPASTDGVHYRVASAAVQPPLPERLRPRAFVAGTSGAGREAARALGVPQLTHPLEAGEYELDDAADRLRGSGIRLGVLARDTHEQAWAEAGRRFPWNPRVEALLARRMRLSDSRWVAELAAGQPSQQRPGSPYWVYPFRSGREYCSFLVGSHAEVGEYLARYLRLGVSTLVLHTVNETDDLPHALLAVHDALGRLPRITLSGAGSPPR